METLLRRYARTHVPFPTAQAARRFGVDPTPALKRLEAAGELVRGELLPGGSEREWCDPDVLRRLRRASLAVLRKEVEAADTAELARFLVSWQNVDAYRSAGAGPDRLREILVPLQGVALTPEVWERDVLPRRLGAYSQTWLDQLSTGGEIVWIGAGPVGRTGAGRLLFPRGRPARRPAAGERQARAARGRGPRRDPRAARAAPLLLARPRRRPRRRRLGAGGAPLGALGPRLGGRGDQRRRRAAPRSAPEGVRVGGRPPRPPVQLAPQRDRPGRRRPLVADRVAVPGRAAVGTAAAGPGGADARALRDRHPRDRPRRGRSRRVLGALRRALEPRDARHRPPRLLRRGPRRRPVRARRCRRAAAVAAPRRRRARRPRRDRSGAALRRQPLLAAAARPRGRGSRRRRPRRAATEPRRRRLRRPPQRRAGCSTSNAAARACSASPASTRTASPAPSPSSSRRFAPGSCRGSGSSGSTAGPRSATRPSRPWSTPASIASRAASSPPPDHLGHPTHAIRR